MQKRPRILIVSLYFPPRRRVGSLRAFRFASFLLNEGYQVAVISIKTKGQLTSEEQFRLNEIQLIEINTPFDFTQHAGSVIDQSPNKKKKRKILSLDFIDRLYPVDTWWPLLQLRWPKLKKIAFDFKPDIILSSSDPWSGLWLGYKLKQALKIPWIADLRDPWVQCSYRNKNRPYWVQTIQAGLEKKWLYKADKITFTAKKTAEKYKSAYPELSSQIELIFNSFDDFRWKSGELKYSSSQNFINKNDKVKFIFFGNFRGLSRAYTIITVLKQLKLERPDLISLVEIYSSSPLQGQDLILAAQSGLLDIFKTAPYVPNTQSTEFLRNFDLLLTCADIERDDIIPAKFWDYLPVGRPIYSLVANQELRLLIDELKVGIQFHPSKEINQAVKKLIEILDAKKNQDKNIPLDFFPKEAEIMKYSSFNTSKKLEKLFIEVSPDKP